MFVGFIKLVASETIFVEFVAYVVLAPLIMFVEFVAFI